VAKSADIGVCERWNETIVAQVAARFTPTAVGAYVSLNQQNETIVAYPKGCSYTRTCLA
jgi:hypothetical protein